MRCLWKVESAFFPKLFSWGSGFWNLVLGLRPGPAAPSGLLESCFWWNLVSDMVQARGQPQDSNPREIKLRGFQNRNQQDSKPRRFASAGLQVPEARFESARGRGPPGSRFEPGH
jgi:hypothetical protein